MHPTLTPSTAADAGVVPGTTSGTTSGTPPGTAPGQTLGPAARGRRVTDAPTRAVHAMLAVTFAGAWLTGDSEQLRALHVAFGYTLAALVGWRLVDGLFGPRPLRLASMWRRAWSGVAWCRTAAQDLLAGRLPSWRQAPAMLMGTVLLAVLAVLPLVAAAGYATFSDGGGEAFEDLHEALANIALGLVLLHLALLAMLGVVRRQNPASAMLSGRVPGRGPDLVPRQRHALAVILVVAAVAFGAWQWSVVAAAADTPSSGGEHRGKLADDD